MMVEISEKFGRAEALIDEAAILLLGVSSQLWEEERHKPRAKLAKIILRLATLRGELSLFAKETFTAKNLISDAAKASEVFGDDECERFADNLRKKNGEKT